MVYRAVNPWALKNIAKGSLLVIWMSNNKFWVTLAVFEDLCFHYFVPKVELYCCENGTPFKMKKKVMPMKNFPKKSVQKKSLPKKVMSRKSIRKTTLTLTTCRPCNATPPALHSSITSSLRHHFQRNLWMIRLIKVIGCLRCYSI
ncbi:uncharacterized protein [Macrobrachium rosenbergii]|uniref:uncharacterized protein n=1 Tax=Macrobrachium rosenbergii TaxID=79674 RepID=UPI0034D778A7